MCASARVWRWEPTRQPKADHIARMSDRVRKIVAKAGSPPATYVYKQADGTPYLRESTAAATRASGNRTGTATPGSTVHQRGRRIPYRLPERHLRPTMTCLIVEGEKDADNVAALGFTVTTNSGGAGKCTAELAEYFKGRTSTSCLTMTRPARTMRSKSPQRCLGWRGRCGLWTFQACPQGRRFGLACGRRHRRSARGPVTARAGDRDCGTAAACQVERGVLRASFRPIISSMAWFSGASVFPHGADRTRQNSGGVAPVRMQRRSGFPIGKRDVDPGRVLYLAGENPDDVRMRWIALSEKMDFDLDTIDVHFLAGVLQAFRHRATD